VASVVAVVVLAGCGHDAGPVPVTVPTGSAGDAVCATLAQHLPATLEGRKRRTTTPTSVRVTAWGDPAVVLRCGVPSTADTGDHVTVNGVGWRTAGPAGGQVVWTTTDRSTGIELSVPDSVDDQETVLADLAAAVSGSVSRVPAPASATAGTARPSTTAPATASG
jgi:hypothetical protein